MDSIDQEPQQDGHVVPAATIAQPGRTLLPAPVAQAVSLATRSTSLAIRVGSFFGAYGLDAARFTTLSSLELARGMVEGVLSRAGRDTIARSGSDLAVAEAETTLERSLESLHHAVTQVVFWTSAGFQLTNTTLGAASEASQLMLSSLDQLLGSTDSSRAIASIITLIRREFQNPATGVKGEKVGVMDLVLALSALAYLQRWCWRTAEEERRRHAYEEVIWDVVVLNDGQRVDVHQESMEGVHPGSYNNALSGDISRPVSSHAWQAEDDEAIMARLKTQIAAALAPGTNVSVSNSVSSVQTITVDVEGPQPISLPTPPGAEVVETRALGPLRSHGQEDEQSYRVVYKIERNKFRATSFRREDEGSDPAVVEVTNSQPLVVQGPGALKSEDSLQAMTDTPSPGLTSTDAISFSDDSDARSAPPPPPKSPTTGQKRPAVKTDEADGRKQSRTSEPAENAANQKRTRTPLHHALSRENLEQLRKESLPGKKTLTRKKTESSLSGKTPDKKSGLKQVFKEGSQSLSNIWNKDAAQGSSASAAKQKPQWRGGGTVVAPGKSKPAVPLRNPKLPPRGGLTNRRVGQTPEPGPRSSSRASYVSIHERRRDSIVSQADSYSVHSGGGLRPASPTFVRTEVAGHESVARPRSGNYSHLVPPSPSRGHRRIGSHVPSLYSLATNDSQTSLVLSSYYQKSAYSASDALATLRREGFVDGSFPSAHLLQNITRYMRFSSASYGSHFLKMMGISKEIPTLNDGTHHDVRHFVHHTESQAGNILLASFVDPQGGTDSTGATGTGVPLVHYISLDHEAKAVVLACRGTLGFEDVMADMSCDYDTLAWRGRSYKVHKGVHASARRLIYGGDGRVLITLKEALDEFPEYGVVLCGHSLGGAVTSILGAMLAEPNANGTGFVTSGEPESRFLTDGSTMNKGLSEIRLPAGRRIHVYAYGPPGCMSPSLCKITRGLITSVVHGNDIVPHLSLGVLHDLQAVALSFKKEDNQAKAEIRQRMWAAFQASLADRWYGASSRSAAPGSEEERWMLPALSSLRASMRSEKLMPPGEVFTVESQRVLRRDAFLLVDEEHIGRPAQRVVLKYVKDVEARFAEVRFGASMLVDHSPAKYEEALNKLRAGVAE